MKSIRNFILVLFMAIAATGCTRIGTGEVGIRVDTYKQVQGSEIMPGSMPQTLFGDVLRVDTKDISVSLNDQKPMTADNSPLSDFDLTVVYSLTPNMIADTYANKSKSFHGVTPEGDILLMSQHIETMIKNASYKVVRKYKSLEVADSRQKVEQEIKDEILDLVKEQQLDKLINITSVQVRNIMPNAEILASATAYVKSQNELKIKENEVKIAEAESRRMAALAANSGQSIAYMQAQAGLNISEAVKAGKVNTIIVPSNMTSLMINK